MGIPRLDSCCCGCTLRTGSLILLYLYLVGSILAPFSNTPQVSQDGKTKQPEVPPAAKIPGAIIGIIVSVCGLYGVYTERQGFLIPYLIMEAIFVIILVVAGVLCFAISVIFGLIVILIALLPVYFWLVVYNHYRELEEGKRSSSAA